MPIFFCAGHASNISLGWLGQPDVGAHPVNPVSLVKKPRVFSQHSQLFGSEMVHVLSQTAGSLHTMDKDTLTT